MLLCYGYMRNNLVHLGAYPTQQDVADMPNLFLFLFCVYMIKGDDCLLKSRLLKRNGMKKNRYKHFRQPVETKLMQMGMYQFKLKKNLFLSRGYEHVPRLVRWNRLYIDTKILLSQTAYRDIFSI